MKIQKNHIYNLLDELMKSNTVFAPQKDGAVTNIKKLENSANIDLKTVRPQTPAKDVLFPQKQTIYKVDNFKVTETNEVKPTILFGCRPCDARGMQILDNFFTSRDRKDGRSQPWEDPYWKKMRENTVIISIACETPLNTCSCTSLGINPASKKGSDILLIPFEDGYFIQPVTDKGRKTLECCKQFIEVTGDVKAVQEKVKAKCESMMTFKLDASPAGKLIKLYGSNIWKKISQGCISCGVCTFFCPTCHCFEMRDEKLGKTCSDKVKCWDSCHFNVYSLEASGHNPRPNVAARYQNKLLDKFEYHVTLYGEIACTGCGRCSDFCPAGITLADTLKTLGGAI